jgi:hypothetical protein
VRYGTDYAEVGHRGGGGKPHAQAEALAAFFGPQRFRVHAFENVQDFDFDGVRGRLLSASYVPKAGHPDHEPLLAALRDLFDRHAERGRIAFAHDTRAYVGRLDG